MNFNKKRFGAGMLTAILASATIATTTNAVNADTATGTPEEQADITNWIANTPQQVSNNMAMQHIDVNNLNGVRYVIQWGDTLSSISAATGISVPKLCYDNHIMNANLIYAGNVLILNRNGYVPTDFHPNVNPYVVAQTKVTINNGPQVVNIKVQPKAIEQYYDNSTNTDNSDNSTNTTNIYKAPGDSSHSTSENKDNDDKDSSSSDKSSAISAEDIASGLDKANDNDKLSFQATDDDSDVKDADELNIDSDEIKKDAKKDDYSDLLDKINDALDKDDDKDVTIYIEEDGDEIHIYVSHDKDSDKDSSSDEDKQSSDEDSQDKSTDNDDEDSQSSDKDSNDEDSQSDDNQSSNQTDSNDQATDEDDD